MKNLIVSVFCITYLFPAVSVGNDCRELCDVMANAGEVIMKGHQTGYPMKKMIAAYSGAGAGAGAGDNIDELIMVAYNSPRYSTEESQQRAIGEYRDKVYLECVGRHNINSLKKVAMPQPFHTTPIE